MPASYYVEHPRGFANEYAVYVVKDRMAFKSAIPDAKRITRVEAIRLGWSRPREAQRTGEQWYGGFFTDNRTRDTDTLDQSLDECLSATQRRLDELAPAE